jgi:peptide-methionine (R)-S-oxide reductase
MRERMVKSEAEWREILTPEPFAVTCRKQTEPVYTGRYCDFQGGGVYRCVCCGNALFNSGAKFEARSKWPTFWAPVAQENIRTARDILHFMIRHQILCACCDAHLGYLFEDGRPPAGVRYFINSRALTFVGMRGRAEHASLAQPALKPDDHLVAQGAAALV